VIRRWEARTRYDSRVAAARCSPVRVERVATRSAGVPSKTIVPPSWPAPGPRVDDPVGVRHDRLVVLDDDDDPACLVELRDEREARKSSYRPPRRAATRVSLAG
jgi:hypothetical protein